MSARINKPITLVSPDAPFSERPVNHDWITRPATVRAAIDALTYTISIDGQDMPATVGAMLPLLMAEDVVWVAQQVSTGQACILAVLVPVQSSPLAQRPLSLRSDQSITLTCGATSVALSAEGLARVVALNIEHDARDSFNVGAAEIRMN